MEGNNGKGFTPNRMTYIIIISGFVISMFFNYWLHRPKNDLAKDNLPAQIQRRTAEAPFGGTSIENLTNATVVINYVKSHHELPECYVTKSEARKAGWNPSQGNLCEVLPGKAIGGDHFSNREKSLPAGNQYFEADVNYHCGNRQTDRIIFTKNGDVWLTKDHYRSFEKQ